MSSESSRTDLSPAAAARRRRSAFLEGLPVDEQEPPEATLQRERELLRKLVDAVPVMVTIYDPAIRTIRVNREFEEVLGWTNEDLATGDVMELCYPDPEAREEVRRFMTSLESGWRDFEMRAKDGRILETIWANIRLSDDRQVGIGLDISERKRAEWALRQAKEEAERANAEKSRLVAVISHDLRTPLNSVLGFADLLLMGTRGTLNEGQRHQVERIRESARQQLSLIQELLAYTKIEAGREALQVTRTDVGALLRSAAEAMRPQARRKGLDLQVEMEGESVSVETDAGKLRQVVLNLLGNAVKFTQSGGIRAWGGVEEGQVVLRFRDTGPGIPEDMQRKIFEPFARGGGSDGMEGTGLGLAIVERLVTFLGGSVELESAQGSGSTFTVRIPTDPPRRA